MTASTLSSEAVLAPTDEARARRYVVTASGNWGVAAAWARAGEGLPGTAFQDARWLKAWYDAHRARADVEPLIVAVTEEGGRPALLLPLVRRRVGRLRVVEFADLGLTDYNLPLLGPAAPRDPAGAARLWRAVRRALSGDLVRLQKMPPTIGGRPNPLAFLPGAAPCALTGNIITVGDSFEAYLRGGIARPVRMELERSWRVFQRHPDARFRRITDPVEAAAILDVMDRQQRARMEAVGNPYDLDRPEAATFYRSLVREHLADGYAVLTALTAGDEVVAAVLGVHDGEMLVVIRLSNAGGKAWSNCSPGRLILERTLRLFHGEGCRRFDFSIGDYDYKRRFGVEPTPLLDLTAALGPRGLPGLVRARVAAFLRRRPALDAKVRQVLGLRSAG